MFKKYYICQFQKKLNLSLHPSDGLGYDAVWKKLEQQKLTIPKALFEYYALTGDHWLNITHNQLLTIEELEWVDDKLVFMQENQGIACWGIIKADASKPNPFVWQGVNGQWDREEYRLSKFLIRMWQWTIAEEPE
ncbi:MULTISPECIES: hypothetical protein [Nostocales]